MKKSPTTIDELLSCSFIILDKPRGPSTHEVTTYIRKLLGVKKTGQMGTLDPKASGVLVIGIGKAVRLLRFVDMKEKTYVGVMRTRIAPKNMAELQAEFDKHTGSIRQMPPRESAVAKRRRTRKVYELRVRDIINNTALFESRVEAGTYIRVLCTEVGKRFGMGKMIELRRTSVGSFTESDAIRLPDLVDAAYKFKMRKDASELRRILHPAQEMVHLPRLYVADAAVDAIGRGALLAPSGVADAEAGIVPGAWVQLMAKDGSLLAIGRKESDLVKPKIVLR